MRSILPDHSALAERPQHLVGIVEIGHFDVRSADALGIVSVRADARSDIELVCEFDRGHVVRRVRDFGVEHFDQVQVTRCDKPLQRCPSQAGAFGIKRVRRVHQATLCFDALDHLAHWQNVRNPLGQKQTDDLASRSADLLSDDHPDSQVPLESLGGLNRVMVSDAQYIQVDRLDTFSHLFQRGARIARGGRVQMTVKSYPTVGGPWWWPDWIKIQQLKGD